MPAFPTPPNSGASGHGALRRGRSSEPGRIYLVTFATCARKDLFLDFERACVASAAVVDARLWRNSSLLAWVLMPDHWHGLIQIGLLETIETSVRRLKTCSARRINGCRGDHGAVWSRAYHDRALRSEAELLPAARYLVANPLRAGLVTNIGDYPFWDAVWLKS